MLYNGGELGGMRFIREDLVENMFVDQLSEDLKPFEINYEKQYNYGYTFGAQIQLTESALAPKVRHMCVPLCPMAHARVLGSNSLDSSSFPIHIVPHSHKYTQGEVAWGGQGCTKFIISRERELCIIAFSQKNPLPNEVEDIARKYAYASQKDMPPLSDSPEFQKVTTPGNEYLPSIEEALPDLDTDALLGIQTSANSESTVGMQCEASANVS
jgi:hypothetical protein